MSQIITTNLRINKNDWIQLKILAAELNMSVNQYINYLLKNLSTRKILEAHIEKKEILSIWKLGELNFKKSPKGLSHEDTEIYE